MFTGDAESVTEEKMMSGLNAVQTDVLKVAHHGALTSTSQMFLENTGAKYEVIQVGKDNSYGHPSAEVLNLLKQYGVAVFRTDIQGDILCVSDGVNIKFEVERNADADTFAAPKVEPSPTPTQIPQIEKIDEMDYVLNKNSQKFHYPSCGSVAKMKEKNKTYFTGAREELIKRGYEPCGNCMP